MIVLPAVCLFLSITSTISARGIPEHSPGFNVTNENPKCKEDWDGEGMINKVAKYLQENKAKDGTKIDPLMLDNKELGFSFTKLGIHFHAGIRLVGGYINGLSKMTREGAVECSLREDRAVFYAKLRTIKLEASYTGQVKVLGIGPSITATITLADVIMDLTIFQKNKKLTAELEEVDLESKDISAKIDALPILSTFLTLITNSIITFFKARIHGRIEPAIKGFLAKYVSTLNMSIKNML